MFLGNPVHDGHDVLAFDVFENSVMQPLPVAFQVALLLIEGCRPEFTPTFVEVRRHHAAQGDTPTGLFCPPRRIVPACTLTRPLLGQPTSLIGRDSPMLAER